MTIRFEWPTMAMIVLCYGAFFVIGSMLYADWPLVALLLFAIPSALHSSLQHEVLHGHPTGSKLVNELLVFLPLSPFYPYRRFKTLHLRHHHDERLTDPYDDPESYYLDGRRHDELPRLMRMILRANNTMVGRMVLGPLLGIAGFFASELRLMAQGDRRVIHAWALHGAGLALLWLILERGLGVSFAAYVIVSGYLGMSLIAIRTFCEHRAERDPARRTIIVEKSLLSWLFLNNNLHVVHHAVPSLPWYRLPAMMRERRAEWLAMNGGYHFRNYAEIFKAYGLVGKEPVVHPDYPGRVTDRDDRPLGAAGPGLSDA